MVRVILHRPYLRFDPNAYPESQEIVVNAANTILAAYETAFQTKASVFWVWWSIPYRVGQSCVARLVRPLADMSQTFHAGAVCAFIAIREPGTDMGKKCLVCDARTSLVGVNNRGDDVDASQKHLRTAIHLFEDRLAGWNKAHPVQSDLVNGLLRLEKLAT